MSPGGGTRTHHLTYIEGGRDATGLVLALSNRSPTTTGRPWMIKPDRPGPTRRQFLTTTAGATAGMASWLALGKAPAFAQKRELTFLSWNHFVPASDDELRKQAEAFGKANNCTVRVDTMAHLQMS